MMRVPKAPCTVCSARRAQDCSVTMALHVTASDGKKGVPLEGVGCPLGSSGSDCTVFLAAAGGLLSLSFLKGLLPACQLTWWPSKE